MDCSPKLTTTRRKALRRIAAGTTGLALLTGSNAASASGADKDDYVCPGSCDSGGYPYHYDLSDEYTDNGGVNTLKGRLNTQVQEHEATGDGTGTYWVKPIRIASNVVTWDDDAEELEEHIDASRFEVGWSTDDRTRPRVERGDDESHIGAAESVTDGTDDYSELTWTVIDEGVKTLVGSINPSLPYLYDAAKDVKPDLEYRKNSLDDTSSDWVVYHDWGVDEHGGDAAVTKQVCSWHRVDLEMDPGQEITIDINDKWFCLPENLQTSTQMTFSAPDSSPS